MYEEALRRSHGDHATAAAKTEEKFSYVVNQLSPANGYVLLWLGASAFLLTMSFGSNGHVLRASACGLAAVELGHLLLFALPYNPWAPTRFFLEPSDVARLIQREPVPGQRVFTDPAAVDAGGVRAKWGRLGALSEGDLKLIFEQRELLVPDTNVVFGVEELGCRFTFSPRRLWYWTEKRLEQMLGGSEDEVARAVGVLRKFGVRWLITTEERATRIPGRIIARWPMTGAALVRLQEPRTSQNGIYRCLAYVPRKVIVASDAERANEYMELYSLDPDVAVIECPANGSARAGAGVVRHASYSGDQAQVWVDMAKAGLVVLGVQFDPGWNITIDGKREHLAVVRANSILTGLEAPPGRHCIALRYHPPGLTAGGAASALGIAVWIVLLVCARARKG
ncbi:MAG: YfhO family protein [Armatimonadetes bacterium]|nr:YfhO family protein [Armatimonadota bacterium]